MVPTESFISRFWNGDRCQPVVYSFGKEEAERRIREKIKSALSGFGREGFRGSVRNGRIMLYWHKPVFGATYPAVFRGVFVDTAEGCQMEGRISRIRVVPMIYHLSLGLTALAIGYYKPVTGFSLAAIAIVAVSAFFQRVNYSERQNLLSELKAI